MAALGASDNRRKKIMPNVLNGYKYAPHRNVLATLWCAQFNGGLSSGVHNNPRRMTIREGSICIE